MRKKKIDCSSPTRTLFDWRPIEKVTPVEARTRHESYMHSDGVWFISISRSMKHLSVLLLPPGQDACQSREFLLFPVLAVFSI